MRVSLDNQATKRGADFRASHQVRLKDESLLSCCDGQETNLGGGCSLAS